MGWSGFGLGLLAGFDLCLGCGFLVSLFVFLCLGFRVGGGRMGIWMSCYSTML